MDIITAVRALSKALVVVMTMIIAMMKVMMMKLTILMTVQMTTFMVMLTTLMMNNDGHMLIMIVLMTILMVMMQIMTTTAVEYISCILTCSEARTSNIRVKLDAWAKTIRGYWRRVLPNLRWGTVHAFVPQKF